MYRTNLFKEIKEYLKPEQVAEYYIAEKGKRSGSNVFYKSPFRNEKTASFCVNNSKGFHDFGTGWHGDIFNFVSKLYNIAPLDAAKILIKDFSLPIKLNKRIDYKEAQKIKEKNITNKNVTTGLDKWYNSTFIKVCDEYKKNEKIIEIMKKQLKEEENFKNKNLLQALQYLYFKENLLELYFEYFNNVRTEEEKLKLFRNRKEVEKYVNR